jgi:nucleotide-binding universal stress UspA family protein
MYRQILVAHDGSSSSNFAVQAAFSLAERVNDSRLIGCHVYAARMHRTRFEDMEPGLPENYQEEERLDRLRNTHDGLISEGMVLISDAYLSPLARAARAQGIPYEGITPEGRNYVELLRVMRKILPDLTILGAVGHGAIPETPLGSLTERTLLHAPGGDLLVMRRAWDFRNRPIVVGVDGSENSYAALSRAIEIGRIYDARIDVVAVYDPFFHSGVFRTIADALPDEARERFDFAAQEQLHDEIIDEGLEHLYRDSLERGVLLARSRGVEIDAEVVPGKVCSQLHHYASLRGAALVVLGRWGLHREAESLIGSNTMNTVRMSTTNVLVVSPPEERIEVPKVPETQGEPLPWTSEAEEILHRIPPFAQKMARMAIEDHARARGCDKVTPELVQEVGQRLGMGR